jgi:hypothetical protein
VRRLPANDAAERDDTRVAARLRERHRRERQLECPGHGHDGDRLPADARRIELAERGIQEPVRDLAVVTRRHDCNAAPRAVGLALDDVDIVGNVELTGRMLLVLRLHGRPQHGHLLVLLGGSRSLFRDALFFLDFRNLRRVVRPTLAHSPPSSGSYFKSWWCSL